LPHWKKGGILRAFNRIMAPVISAIILAAGESRRIGRPKLLLPLGQRTILEQTIDSYLGSKVSEVIVVVGDRAEEITSLISDRPVKVVKNPAYRQGMSTSIRAGLKVSSAKTSAVILVLADQPFIDARTINLLMEAFDAHSKGIALPVYQGRRGHPVIFDIKYIEELLRLKGDIGGREIIARYPDDVLEVIVDCEGVTIDIDTMDLYHLEKEKQKGIKQ